MLLLDALARARVSTPLFSLSFILLDLPFVTRHAFCLGESIGVGVTQRTAVS